MSRGLCGFIAAVAGLLALLAHWGGAPDPVAWTCLLVMVVYLVVMLLPERVRQHLTWGLE